MSERCLTPIRQFFSYIMARVYIYATGSLKCGSTIPPRSTKRKTTSHLKSLNIKAIFVMRVLSWDRHTLHARVKPLRGSQLSPSQPPTLYITVIFYICVFINSKVTAFHQKKYVSIPRLISYKTKCVILIGTETFHAPIYN